MSKKIVIGNWKMNPLSVKEAESIFFKISKNLKTKKVDVVTCPPVIYFNNLKKISRRISIGAQNTFYGDTGAQTGEVSAPMLALSGVKYVILGHSERRAMGENNELVNKKIKSALSAGLTPILCVGEKERDPEHLYLAFIQDQIKEGLSGVSKNSLDKVIIAYEPVWAIGKNAVRGATGEEFREISIFIRKTLTDMFGVKFVEMVRIIYGGSVNPKNALEFLVAGKADGFLVGRDSLSPEKFLQIISITESII